MFNKPNELNNTEQNELKKYISTIIDNLFNKKIDIASNLIKKIGLFDKPNLYEKYIPNILEKIISPNKFSRENYHKTQKIISAINMIATNYVKPKAQNIGILFKHWYKIAIRIQRKELLEAENLCEKYLAQNPKIITTHLLLMITLMRQDRHKDADKYGQKILKTFPNCNQLKNILTYTSVTKTEMNSKPSPNTYSKSGNYDKAIELYKKKIIQFGAPVKEIEKLFREKREQKQNKTHELSYQYIYLYENLKNDMRHLRKIYCEIAKLYYLKKDYSNSNEFLSLANKLAKHKHFPKNISPYMWFKKDAKKKWEVTATIQQNLFNKTQPQTKKLEDVITKCNL
ncbi:MAG: hypothetical protein PVI75_08005 [Gammaproteobacteria bacterium]|jgi:hypothetical protein